MASSVISRGRRPYWPENSFRKWRARSGISSLRSRKRRHGKGNHVQAVEKVLAKISAGNFFFQVFVGRGDHAGVDGNGLVAAHGSEVLFFERAQNLRLRLQAHVADFVEEERSAVGLQEFAFLVCSGQKGSAAVTK